MQKVYRLGQGEGKKERASLLKLFFKKGIIK